MTRFEQLSLKQLTIFLEIASRRSFSGAAEALGKTQPAVSRAISELEDALGTKLFERSRRGVFMTPSGEVLRHHAGAAVASIQRGIAEASATDAEQMVLSIGALPTVAGSLVPSALRSMLGDGFTGQMRVRTGPYRFLIDELKVGRLDVVVGRLGNEEDMNGLRFERLFVEPIVLAARVGHPLLERPNPDLAMIAEYTVLSPAPGDIVWPEVRNMLTAAGISRLPQVIDTVSPAFALSYLQMSDAVWIISRSVVQSYVDTQSLAVLPIDTGSAKGAIGLTIRDEDPMPRFIEPLAKAFRDEVRHRQL